MAIRTGRSLISIFILLAAGVAAGWLARRCQPQETWPDEQRWPAGSRVRWADEPYVEQGPSGERFEVRAGDEGTVVVDDSPIEFCVTFPATGAFCPPRTSVVLLERAAGRNR